jgi:hypothetical protein
MIKLGQTGIDIITGFSGVVMGKAQYLTGCNQVLIVPRELAQDSKRRDGEWFDEQRIDAAGDDVVVLNGTETYGTEKHPGADERHAPTR